MATETTLRYIKIDYQSQKDALLQRIRARWPRSWNDFLSNSFGIVLVDIVAWGLATLAFLINRIGGENYVGTMTLRESAVRLGTLTGYQLHGPVPATVACEATLASASSARVKIAKGTIIRTSDDQSLPFEVVEDYYIEAGNLTTQTPVATFSSDMTGSQVIDSFVSVTSGSTNADLVDTTIDLTQFIQAGQSFIKLGSSDVYRLSAIESAPGAISPYTRMVLDKPYAGSTEITAAEVFDQRIQCIEGQTVVDRFIAPTSQVVAQGFTVKLSRTPVIDDSIEVTVNGELWEKVTSTTLRTGLDNAYQVRTFVSGATAVLFGDGQFGAILPSDAAIAVSYRIGGGLSGNIELNTINTSVTGIVETTSNPIPISISNQTSTGIGGQDAETLEQARINIPYYTRTNDRAVTIDDYQTIAQSYRSAQYGSVAYARAGIRNENALLEGNIVVIYAWTTGSGGGLVALSPQLKLALQSYMQTKAVGTDLVQIYDGTNRPVPVSLRFKVFSGFSVSETKNLVTNTIKAFVTALRPGQPVLYSNFVRALDETYGVDTVNMATPINDLTPSNSTELFTPPQDNFVYAITRNSNSSSVLTPNGETVSLYAAQLPIFPLAVWSFRLFLGVNELTLLPYVRPGYARVIGSNLSTDDTDADADGLGNYHSTVNLLTGTCSLWIKGAPGDLTMKLVSAAGYSTNRLINVYIGYIGDNTQTKRREIRSALRAWSDGLTIGGPIYGQNVAGVVASSVSITDVVASVKGVDSVTRVALDTPANNEDRVTAADYELLQLGNIVLNNQVDVILIWLIPAATAVFTAWHSFTSMC